jgi:GLPGLI family protein
MVCARHPVRFGPIGYGGLPGLILELQNESATFYVTKINLNPDSPPEIDKLSPKAISKEG